MKYAALVTLVDNNWLHYAKQVFSGAHFNAGWQHDYVLMTVGVPEHELDWFKKRGIYIYNCSPLHRDIGVDPSALKTTIYRMYLFTDFFKQWEYIVFVDSDIIIRGSLDCLLLHKGFMAAEDSNRNTLDWQLRGERSTLNTIQDLQYKRIKQNFNLHESTFNAGIMSIHTSSINDTTYNNLCVLYKQNIELFANHMHDQVLLNIYYYKKWLTMPSQFNVFVNYDIINYNRRTKYIDAYILHFAGTMPYHKPWDAANPFYKEWRRLLLKADAIDLRKRKPPKKSMSYEDAVQSSTYLSNGWIRFREKIKRRYKLRWHLKKALNY